MTNLPDRGGARTSQHQGDLSKEGALVHGIDLDLDRFFPSFLSKMHEKGGQFLHFPLKIAEKEGKTDLVFDDDGRPMALKEHLVAHLQRNHRAICQQ